MARKSIRFKYKKLILPIINVYPVDINDEVPLCPLLSSKQTARVGCVLPVKTVSAQI